jgi:hypothetical protein
MKASEAYLTFYNVVQGIGWIGVLLGMLAILYERAPAMAAFHFGAGPAGEPALPAGCVGFYNLLYLLCLL